MALVEGVCCYWGSVIHKELRVSTTAVSFGRIGAPVLEVLHRARMGVECRQTRVHKVRRENYGFRGTGDLRRGTGPVVVASRGGSGTSRSKRVTTSRGSPASQQQEQPLKSASRQIGKKETTPKKTKQKVEDDEDALDEDALEALFAQLEKDLEEGYGSELDDLTEEEVIEFENELDAVLMQFEDGDEGQIDLGLMEGDAKKSDLIENKSAESECRAGMEEDEDKEDDEGEEEERRVINLETWQLKKLTAAAQLGRRRVNVKALAAEVGLDRSDVLAWLKNPPPELLMYNGTMEAEKGILESDEDKETLLQGAVESSRPSNTSSAINQEIKDQKSNDEGSRKNWFSQKRLKKEHQATFERVFRSTDRPSNAMIQNLVELTHVPRKRVVEWFEERRKGLKPASRSVL